ncbi:MAG TPA: histidine kinase [Terriglobia bacterium]|jgi:two-component system LytT family sensor kinase|nr:histidine kinase [Terriglobia bacterium]
MNPGTTTFILVTLLIKLGLIAALASIIARFGLFKRLIFVEQRTPRQKLQFAAFLGVPFMLATLTRLVAHYPGADLSLEATVLAGLLGGTITGLVVGMMVSLPAWLHWGEFLAPLMATLYAVTAGTGRWICPDKEAIWKFSPFVDLSLYRSIRQRFRAPVLDWQVLFALICVILEISRMIVSSLAPHALFGLNSPHLLARALIVLGTLAGVGVPVRIWNTTRIERKLEEQQRLLMEARVDALISQINPHFLFNTLNTVSSLIRFDPDTARNVVLKLSNILRRRLRVQAHFLTLRQELDFIDDYLSIEVVRFGSDKLRVRKEIDPDTFEMTIPSMLLQPMVENSIRHGIGPKVEGGTITLRTSRHSGRLLIEVGDDGVGISPERQRGVFESGIGIRNVRERLHVLYGEDFTLRVESQAGQGTSICIELPELITPDKKPEPALTEAGR